MDLPVRALEPAHGRDAWLGEERAHLALVGRRRDQDQGLSVSVIPAHGVGRYAPTTLGIGRLDGGPPNHDGRGRRRPPALVWWALTGRDVEVIDALGQPDHLVDLPRVGQPPSPEIPILHVRDQGRHFLAWVGVMRRLGQHPPRERRARLAVVEDDEEPPVHGDASVLPPEPGEDPPPQNESGRRITCSPDPSRTSQHLGWWGPCGEWARRCAPGLCRRGVVVEDHHAARVI